MAYKKIADQLSATALAANPNFTPADPYAPEPKKSVGSGIAGAVSRLLEKAKEKERKKEEPYRRALSLMPAPGMKKGGKVSASKRADGICKKGKTKGRMV